MYTFDRTDENNSWIVLRIGVEMAYCPALRTRIKLLFAYSIILYYCTYIHTYIYALITARADFQMKDSIILFTLFI